MANAWWQRERPVKQLTVDDYLGSNPRQLAKATTLAFEQLADVINQLSALPRGERHQRATEYDAVREDFIELGNRLNVAFFSDNQDVELDELNETLSAYRSGTSLLAKVAGLAGDDRMSSALQAGLFENATPMRLVSAADIDEARLSIAKLEHVIGDHVLDPLFDPPHVTQSADDLSGVSDSSLNNVEYEGSLAPPLNQDVTR